MGLWAVKGFGFACTQIPVGRILNRSASDQDRPAVFAAQFALSHACWLVTYPLAGWMGAQFGLPVAAIGLSARGAVAMAAVLRLWPAQELDALQHDHPDLPADHPHLLAHTGYHRHAIVIDDLHR